MLVGVKGIIDRSDLARIKNHANVALHWASQITKNTVFDKSHVLYHQVSGVKMWLLGETDV